MGPVISCQGHVRQVEFDDCDSKFLRPLVAGQLLPRSLTASSISIQERCLIRSLASKFNFWLCALVMPRIAFPLGDGARIYET